MVIRGCNYIVMLKIGHSVQYPYQGCIIRLITLDALQRKENVIS